MNKSISFSILAAIVLIGCSTSPQAIQTAIAQTQRALPTETLFPTQTAIILIVTATLSPTPLYTNSPIQTPTITLTPKPTATTPPPTQDITKTTKKEGTWLVGSEVSIGHWRAIGGDCYAVAYDSNGTEQDMVSGVGSILNVSFAYYSVEFVSYPGSCTWEYIGQ
jgi:hypothetical protein